MIKNTIPDKSTTVFTYCLRGSRSRSAAKALKAKGYTNVINMGGKKGIHILELLFPAQTKNQQFISSLAGYEETPGASETVNGWIDSGHTVSIITGRPYSAYEPSRIWLDQHDLGRAALYCLDKYGRDSFIKGSTFSLELEDYYKMEFDYAIEDSPAAFKFFAHMPKLKVMVFDRPWNQSCEFPGKQYHRCFSWDEIKNLVKSYAE